MGPDTEYRENQNGVGEAVGLEEVGSAKSQKELGEVRNLINRYITHLLGFPPRLHKFL